MKSGSEKPKGPAFSPQEVINAINTDHAKGGAGTPKEVLQPKPTSYIVTEGSTQSDPVRRANMLRDRIADTEKLIMAAPSGERKDMHRRMLPLYKKQLADLEHGVVSAPETAEFPPAHEMVSPEALFRVKSDKPQSPTETPAVAAPAGNRLNPDAVIAAMNARHEQKTVASKPSAPVPTPETQSAAARKAFVHEERVRAVTDAPARGAAVRAEAVPQSPEPASTIAELTGTQGARATFEKIAKDSDAAVRAGTAEAFPRSTGAAPLPSDNRAQEMMDIFNARQSKAAEARTREAASPVASKFEKAFGIAHSDLEQIDGFTKLSSAQQKLVFENLSSFAQSGSSFMGGVWEGLIGTKNAVPPKGSRGMGAYGPMLAQLIGAVADGPNVYEEKDGTLLPSFMKMPAMEGKRDARYQMVKAIEAFNKQAHTMVRTPASWLQDGIGTHSEKKTWFSALKDRFSKDRKNYNEYQNRQAQYDTAKKLLSEEMERAGFSPAEVAAQLIEADKHMFEMQFLQTSPDAAREVQNIPKQSFWKQVGEQMKSAGGYAALGFVWRSATAEALHILSGPVLAAAIGSTRGWNKSAALIRERDRVARMHDPELEKLERDYHARKPGTASAEEARKKLEAYRAGMLNIVDAQHAVKIGKYGSVRESGLTSKIVKLNAEYEHATLMRAEAEAKGDVDAISAWNEKRDKLLERMVARVQYAEDKQKLNRISFGTRGERGKNVADFWTALGQAKVHLAEEGMRSSNPKNPETTEGRLKHFLDVREDRMQRDRRVRQVKSAAWAGTKAAGFALAGAYAAEALREAWSGTPSATETFSTRNNAPVGTETSSTSSAAEAFAQHTAENVSSAEQLAPYTIQKGDNLWDILSDKTELAALGETRARENAVANIVRSLTPRELQEIGITSGDVRKLYPGDSINMERLSAVLHERQSIIESARARFGTLPLSTRPEDILPTQPEASSIAPTIPESAPASAVSPVPSASPETPVAPSDVAAASVPVTEQGTVTAPVQPEATPATPTAPAQPQSLGRNPDGTIRYPAWDASLDDRIDNNLHWGRADGDGGIGGGGSTGEYTLAQETGSPQPQSLGRNPDGSINYGKWDASLDDRIDNNLHWGRVDNDGGIGNELSLGTRVPSPAIGYEAMLPNWEAPQTIETRSDALESFFKARLSTQMPQEQWMRWARAQNIFSNEGRISLEIHRQQWLTDRENLVKLLKHYNIPGRMPNETNDWIDRATRALAAKITSEEYRELFRIPKPRQ